MRRSEGGWESGNESPFLLLASIDDFCCIFSERSGEVCHRNLFSQTLPLYYWLGELIVPPPNSRHWWSRCCCVESSTQASSDQPTNGLIIICTKTFKLQSLRKILILSEYLVSRWINNTSDHSLEDWFMIPPSKYSLSHMLNHHWIILTWVCSGCCMNASDSDMLNYLLICAGLPHDGMRLFGLMQRAAISMKSVHCRRKRERSLIQRIFSSRKVI